MVPWAAEPNILPVTYLFFLSLSVLLTILSFGIFSAVVIGTLEKTRERYSGGDSEEKEGEGKEGEGKEGEGSKGHGKSRLEHEEGREVRSKIGVETSSKKEDEFSKDHALHSENQLEGPVVTSSNGQKQASVGGMKGTVSSVGFWYPRTEEESQLHVQSTIGSIIDSQMWRGLYYLAIIANGIALGADQYDTSDVWRMFCQWTYLSVNIVFMVNLLLQLAACGSVVDMVRSNDTKLEIIMVVFVFAGLASNTKGLVLVAALRVFKLMLFFPALADLLDSAITGTPTLLRVLIFICVVTFVSAVTSRYIIGHSMDLEENSNFADLFSAIRVMFQLITGDAWGSVLYDGMRAQTDPWTELVVGALLLSWFLFSAIIILNLFAAVIVANFDVKDTIER